MSGQDSSVCMLRLTMSCSGDGSFFYVFYLDSFARNPVLKKLKSFILSSPFSFSRAVTAFKKLGTIGSI